MATPKPSITNCPFTFRVCRSRSAYTFSFDERHLFCIQHVDLLQVTIALGFHLFPFRTEKLSLVTPMVLRNSGRVGSRRFFPSLRFSIESEAFFMHFCFQQFYHVVIQCSHPLCFSRFSRFLVGIIFIIREV